MRNLKQVSIAMATYNGEKFIKEQIESILNQTYTNIEIIVYDDCSTDNTFQILQDYAKKDNRIKLFQNKKNLGYVKNFEKAISVCNGDYIALSDQDDIWIEKKIEVLLNEIGDNLLIYSNCSLIDENSQIILDGWKGEIITHRRVEDFLFSNVVTGCTVLMNKELQAKALPFPKGLAYHDWWFSILAANKAKITYSNQILTLYRQHSSQDTSAGDVIQLGILKKLVFLRDIIRRIKGLDVIRLVAYKKHYLNLKAIENDTNFNSEIIKDIIIYFQDYINNKVHFKTFWIGIKYAKFLYPKNNPFFIKNILLDIVG